MGHGVVPVKRGDCQEQSGSCACSLCEADPLADVPSVGDSGAPPRYWSSGPEHTDRVWNLFKQLLHHELGKEQRCVYLESVTKCGQEVVKRSERGLTVLNTRDWGVAPIDDEYPILADGRVVHREDRATIDAATGVQVQTRRWLAFPVGEGWDSLPAADAASAAQRRKRRTIEAILKTTGEETQLQLMVEVSLEPRRVPSRAQIKAAVEFPTIGHRLQAERSRIEAAERAVNRERLEHLSRRLREVDGEVLGTWDFLRGSMRIQIPTRQVGRLAEMEEVVAVERVFAEGGAKESGEDGIGYIDRCSSSATPSRYIAHVDYSSYDGEEPFMDLLNYADGVYDYEALGFTGSGISGLASWGTMEGRSHLTLGILGLDGNVFPMHPAFLSQSGEPRIRFQVRGWNYLGKLHDDVTQVPDPRAGDDHNTRCLAIAFADLTRGQDENLTQASMLKARNEVQKDRFARSGVARGAVAYVGDTGYEDFFAHIDDGKVDGLDVLFIPENDNSGWWANDQYRCPTEDDARGVDLKSQMLVDQMLRNSIVTFKSAGNLSGIMGGCQIPLEISCPGASPAAIAVGAKSTQNQGGANFLKSSTRITAHSASAITLDGRTYPHLIVDGWQCGCATQVKGEQVPRYGLMGDTSGATPRATGLSILLKHWYLANYSASHANMPGRLISKLLNMADGKASLDRDKPDGIPATVPRAGYGLGSLRLRLFEPGFWGPRGGQGTASVVIGDGGTSSATVDLGELPADVRHLRITAWWLEVNTDADHVAPLIQMGIIWNGANGLGSAGTLPGLSPLRLQFDNDGRYYPPPVGRVLLFVHCAEMHREAWYWQRNYRTVYVSWLWETGGERLDPCPRQIPVPELPPPKHFDWATTGTRVPHRSVSVRPGPVDRENVIGDPKFVPDLLMSIADWVEHTNRWVV